MTRKTAIGWMLDAFDGRDGDKLREAFAAFVETSGIDDSAAAAVAGAVRALDVGDDE